MPRASAVAAALAALCWLAACDDDAPDRASDEASAEQPAAAVVRADDPAGDVVLTISATPTLAPDEQRYAQVDLTGAEVRRRPDGMRVVFALGGPVGVEGYRTELSLVASTGARSKPYRSVLVVAYLWPDHPFAGAETSGSGDGTVQCDPEVTVSGREVVVDVPQRCVPLRLRGPVLAGSSLYTDSEDSETALAHDDLRFDGRPGIPAAP